MLSKITKNLFCSNQQMKKTCLNALHKELGGKMVDFAGYELPVQYKAGIMKQHLHCRSAASLFDVSHMGQITISGKYAIKLIQRVSVGSTTRKNMKIDGVQLFQSYLTVFTDQNAGIIDDAIITIVSPEKVRMVVNGANKYIVMDHLNNVNAKQRLMNNIHLAQDRGLIALQGPKAAEVIQKIFKAFNFANSPFMSQLILRNPFGDNTNEEYIVSRCGYTGQDGFQISSVNESVVKLVKKLLQFKDDVLPTGLGARDSLRTQAGLCLHGHDISVSKNPFQAALMWLVYKKQTQSRRISFIGQQKLRAQIEEAKDSKKKVQKRVGFMIEGSGIVRQNCKLFDSNNKEIGITTSGTYGPSLKHCVGMAYVDQNLTKIGTKLLAEQRGKMIEVTVGKMPFVPARYYKDKKWQ